MSKIWCIFGILLVLYVGVNHAENQTAVVNGTKVGTETVNNDTESITIKPIDEKTNTTVKSTEAIKIIPGPDSSSTSTTAKPTSTTPITSTKPSSTSTTSTSTTTISPAPIPPNSTTSTLSPITEPVTPSNTTPSTPHVSGGRKFDIASFLGGGILVAGLAAIAFISHKYYLQRKNSISNPATSGNSYRTL